MLETQAPAPKEIVSFCYFGGSTMQAQCEENGLSFMRVSAYGTIFMYYSPDCFVCTSMYCVHLQTSLKDKKIVSRCYQNTQSNKSLSLTV